jgi:hypothetical protein
VYVKLVIEGRLDKCLQLQEAGAEPPFVLPLLVHRLAWGIFGGAAGALAAGGSAAGAAAPRDGGSSRQHSWEEGQGLLWQEAALLRLARGCAGAGAGSAASGSTHGRGALLRMLLSWDCSSGGAQGGAGALAAPARLDMLRHALRASGDAELERSVLAALG